MNKQTRNKAYPQEFREQVVKLVQAGGQTVSEIAREFEISTDSVRRWLKQAERDAGSRRRPDNYIPQSTASGAVPPPPGPAAPPLRRPGPPRGTRPASGLPLVALQPLQPPFPLPPS